MTWYCSLCLDEFELVEYASRPDEGEPAFCSHECGDKFWEREEMSRLYVQERNSGAPVF